MIKRSTTSDALLNELKSQRPIGRPVRRRKPPSEPKLKRERERQAAIEEATSGAHGPMPAASHKTEAKYSGTLNGEVMLLKRNGSKIHLPLDRLSDEDREWIAKSNRK